MKQPLNSYIQFHTLLDSNLPATAVDYMTPQQLTGWWTAGDAGVLRMMVFAFPYSAGNELPVVRQLFSLWNFISSERAQHKPDQLVKQHMADCFTSFHCS